MKKRLLQIMGIFLCLQSFYMTAGAEEIPIDEPEVEIVETVSIEPDVITLLKNEVRYTQNWETNCSDDTIQISYNDSQILMRIASAEAQNQGIYGMFLVMQTVMNRVNSSEYPDDVWSVVSQPYQFEPITNGSYYTVDIPPEAHEALAMLESNLNADEDIVAFESVNNYGSLTRYYDVAYTYLGHTFYTKKND